MGKGPYGPYGKKGPYGPPPKGKGGLIPVCDDICGPSMSLDADKFTNDVVDIGPGDGEKITCGELADYLYDNVDACDRWFDTTYDRCCKEYEGKGKGYIPAPFGKKGPYGPYSPYGKKGPYGPPPKGKGMEYVYETSEYNDRV